MGQRELSRCDLPIMPGACLLGHDVTQSLQDRLQRGLVRWEVATRLDDRPKLHVQRFDGVGRI